MREGVVHLIYFTWLHNEAVIGFSLAALTTLILLIRRPTRSLVLLFIGFLILMFHFWFQKHIVGNLAAQTVHTLFITDGYYRARWLTDILIYHVAPVALWLVGWGSVIAGLITNWWFVGSKKSSN
jgi:hypothetical protein